MEIDYSKLVPIQEKEWNFLTLYNTTLVQRFICMFSENNCTSIKNAKPLKRRFEKYVCEGSNLRVSSEQKNETCHFHCINSSLVYLFWAREALKNASYFQNQFGAE